MISSKVINGIRLSYTFIRPHQSDKKIGTIDMDEVDEMLKAFKFISDKAFVIAPFETEVVYNYNSRGGITAGAFYEAKRKKWAVYIQLHSNSIDNIVMLDQEDLPKLMDLMAQAKAKLQ